MVLLFVYTPLVLQCVTVLLTSNIIISVILCWCYFGIYWY